MVFLNEFFMLVTLSNNFELNLNRIRYIYLILDIVKVAN